MNRYEPGQSCAIMTRDEVRAFDSWAIDELGIEVASTDRSDAYGLGGLRFVTIGVRCHGFAAKSGKTLEQTPTFSTITFTPEFLKRLFRTGRKWKGLLCN